MAPSAMTAPMSPNVRRPYPPLEADEVVAWAAHSRRTLVSRTYLPSTVTVSPPSSLCSAVRSTRRAGEWGLDAGTHLPHPVLHTMPDADFRNDRETVRQTVATSIAHSATFRATARAAGRCPHAAGRSTPMPLPQTLIPPSRSSPPTASNSASPTSSAARATARNRSGGSSGRRPPPPSVSHGPSIPTPRRDVRHRLRARKAGPAATKRASATLVR